MLAVLRRTFDLRPGELALVSRSGATLFGLIAAHTLLETARDALFLGKLPVGRLPLVYGLLALLSVGAAKANARFIDAFGRRNALIFTLLGSAFGTVVLFLLGTSETVVFVLYAWSGLLGSILVVQFWMLVGHLYTVSQGKRLFGLLAAGGVLGAVVGAGMAAMALGPLEVRELLLIASALFLATAFFLTTEQVDEVVPDQPEAERARSAVNGIFGLFADYPYLFRLAVLVGLSTAAVLTTDYLFKAVAASSRSAAELGPFFARYYAVLNSVALIVQIFVSGALVRRVGVLGAFLVLPTLLAAGGVGSLIAGGGLIVLATKGADGALRHSLHRIAQELLWMPLPEHVRARAKGVVDAVVVRGAQALTAGVLFLLATLGQDDIRVLAGLVAALSLSWVIVGLRLRRPYLDLFRAALGQRSGRGRLELDLRSVEVVVESLSSRDPQQAIAAIDLLTASGRTKLIPALILYHESEEVLLRALEVVPDPDRRDWVPLAERLLSHAREEIRVAALEALARAGHRDAVKSRLLDISPWVRAYAAFWLAQSREQDAPAEDGAIQLLLDMPGSSGRRARAGLLQAIERSGDARWADLLLDLATSEEPEVAQAAVRAMSHVRDGRFIPLLVGRLAIRDGRSTVREAIVALGEPAFAALEAGLKSSATDPRVRVHLPATIARFADRRAAEVLLEALEATADGRVRFKVLRALVLLSAKTMVPLDREVLERRMLHDLREHYRLAALHLCLERALAEAGPAGQESGELLVGLLSDKREQALERVFLLLQAGFPKEDLRRVRAAACSSDRRRRAQAQEFLDALTLSAKTPEVRPLLRLAVDDLGPEERLQRARAELGTPLVSEPDAALQELLQESDAAVSGLAAYHILESGRSGFRQEIIERTRRRPLAGSVNLLGGFDLGEEVPGLA